jgi:hydroxymethylpyrimidine/phosphomethylpyrimidine kinase
MHEMSYDRPIVLTLAGFDPSGGAGVLADCKTFEQHRCLGMAVCTAHTRQTENSFLSCDWVSFETIQNTYLPLFSQYPILYIKIGLIENVEILYKVVSDIKRLRPESFILWDPVLGASAGGRLMNSISYDKLYKALGWIDLITPNTHEAKILAQHENEHCAAETLAVITSVLLKGGHSESEKGVDVLYQNASPLRIPGSASIVHEKHGSGCIVSSAILSQLALGNSLPDSCRMAKKYIESILESNSKLLGYHVA